MAIQYTDNITDLEPAHLKGFFGGWPSRPGTEMHLDILRGSYIIWLALDDNRCVGFINAISDGVFSAFIPLLEVLPEYRGQGIGSELVRRMLDSLDGMYSIDVICDEDVVAFYAAKGFGKCVGMIKRNREQIT